MAEIVVSESEAEFRKKQFTVTNEFTKENIELWRPGGEGRLLVPRGTVSHPVERRDWEEIKYLEFRGDLRPEQEVSLKKISAEFESKSGCILKAETGTGKTVIALKLIGQLGLKTLVVVPTDYLMTQWIERIQQFTTPSESVGIIRQKVCNTSAPISVGMIHTLAKGRNQECFNEFGLVIWDEVHRLAAPTFSETATMFWSRYRLGLSATPRRNDGCENIFMQHIGPVVVAAGKQELTPRVVRLVYEGMDTHHGSCVWGGELHIPSYVNKVSGSIMRNRALAKVIKQAHDKDRNILVLSDRLEHLNQLAKLVNVWGYGVFTGSSKKNLKSKLIFATYGSAGLGADLPHLDTVVFTTPRADVEQAVGRILRRQNLKPPVVIEVLDNRSIIMQKWAKKRDKFYRSKGMEIVNVQV